jgi:hypothetical protein
MESIDQTSNGINKILNYVNNDKILNAVVSMLLVLYAAMAAPKLPESIAKIFDNSYFKIGIMFMIGYLANRDPSTSIIVAVALFVTLQTASSHDTVDKIVETVKPKTAERFIELLASVTPDPKLSVPLSPATSNAIQTAVGKATELAQAASTALANNMPAKADAAQTKAVLQQVKVDTLVKAAELKDAAKKAEAAGNNQVAKESEKKAMAETAKVNLITKHPICPSICM